jgi:hypothetical protein
MTRTATARWRHWWREDPARRVLRTGGFDPDTAKAAVTFEALRRRREILHAQSAGQTPSEWQTPSALAVAWLDQCWAELADDQQTQFRREIQSPFYLPPVGYSYFPDDLEAAKTHALQGLEIPPADDVSKCLAFVAQCRRLQAAGFTVAALDTKTMKGLRVAAMALEDKPRTFRQADVRMTIARRQAQSKKQLSLAASASFALAGHTCINGRWIAARHLHFFAVCEQLERFDRRGVPSEFIDAIRV